MWCVAVVILFPFLFISCGYRYGFCGVFLCVCVCGENGTDAATSAEEYHKFAPFICMKAYLNGNERRRTEKKIYTQNRRALSGMFITSIYGGRERHNGHPFFFFLKTKYGFGMSFWPHNNEHGFLFGVCSERTDQPGMCVVCMSGWLCQCHDATILFGLSSIQGIFS